MLSFVEACRFFLTITEFAEFGIMFIKNALLRVLSVSAVQSPIPSFDEEARKNIAPPGRVNQVPQKVR